MQKPITNAKVVQEAFSKCAKCENKYNAVLASASGRLFYIYSNTAGIKVLLASSFAKMVIFVQNWQVACDNKADEAIRCCWGVIVESRGKEKKLNRKICELCKVQVQVQSVGGL